MALLRLPDTENNEHKRHIITSLFVNKSTTIPELSKELGLSVPTTTKLVNEMLADGIVTDCGKSVSKTGRRPNIYGLNPNSGYFLGIDIKHNYINLGIANFNGEIVCKEMFVPIPEDDSMSTIEEICRLANEFIKANKIKQKKIFSACASISGRVNCRTGYSYSKFNFSETPLAEILSDNLAIPTYVENDTRAITYGEYMKGIVRGERNVLYVNMSWGLGLGIIIGGEVLQGTSGYAGEFGHFSAFDNEILCHCGKKGCLETEVSGMALHRELVRSIKEGKNSMLSQKYNDGQKISLGDIISAIEAEDVLGIELLEDISYKLGRRLADMINLFNPQLVIIGGSLTPVADYMLQPISSAIRKYTLKLVNSDSRIVGAELGEDAGIIGACLIARREMFEPHSLLGHQIR